MPPVGRKAPLINNSSKHMWITSVVNNNIIVSINFH